MRLPFSTSFRALLGPREAFSAAAPTLGVAVWRMSLVWIPLALVNAVWSARRSLEIYEELRHGGTLPGFLGTMGWDPAALQDQLAGLPPAPAFGRIWPWLLLIVPLGVLGTWLHHAVWDHMGLWLVGGLKGNRGFRTSLLAEAEALRIAAVGTLVGLLGLVPGLGTVLVLPLLLLDAYLWGFRGFALAARHGCEPWRGVAATVVHAFLVGCFALALISLTLFIARMAV